MRKNCFNCKNCQIRFENCFPKEELKDFEVIFENKQMLLGDMFGKCDNGNTKELVDFYKKYGKIPKQESEYIIKSCFEETDIQEVIDSIVYNNISQNKK